MFIVGDMTAKIGDPSGRSDDRPALINEDIARNLTTYRDHGMVAGPDTTAQAEQLFANIESALADLGCGPENLVYLNTYLAADASLTDFLRCRDASFRRWDLTEGCPGSTLLIVHSHVSPEYLLEIDATVAVGAEGPRRPRGTWGGRP